jgi:hypothetical protein
MEIQPKQLLLDIENVRKNMIEHAKHSSFTNKSVVDLSIQLDRLLNKYDQITAKKSSNSNI